MTHLLRSLAIKLLLLTMLVVALLMALLSSLPKPAEKEVAQAT